MKRSAIKIDQFASTYHRQKIDQLGDPLYDIGSHIDFPALASEVDRLHLAQSVLKEGVLRIQQRVWCGFWC